MSYAMNPRSESNFRQRSGNASMAGVMSPSFMCPCCKTRRKVLGRKVVDGRHVCAGCAESREHAQA